MKHSEKNDISELINAILSLENEDECARFLEDLCTHKEIDSMVQRLCVARLLKEGKTFQDIVDKTGASTATISRVNRCLMYGNGGYDTVLSK